MTAKLYTNFEEDGNHTNAVPVNWTRRWRAVSDSANQSALVFIAPATNPPPVKRRHLLVKNISGSGHAPFSMDAADPLDKTQVELVTRVFFSTTAGRANLYVRASGDTGSESGIFLAMNSSLDAAGSANTLTLNKIVGGVVTTLATVAKVMTYGTGYFVRFRCQDSSGTNLGLYARVWADDTAEPSTWDISYTGVFGTAPTSNGWVGVGAYGGGQPNAWITVNFLSMCALSGTSDAARAFVPRTNTQYLAWLSNQNAVRRVLVDMAYNGYDSESSTGMVDVPVYVGDGGFATQEYDDPPSTYYRPLVTRVPTFSRTLGTALYGQITVGLGSLQVSNRASAAGGAGELDDWARYKWKRDYVSIWLGDVTWSKADFRKIIVARLGQPAAPDTRTLEFPLADLSALLDGALFTSADAATYNQPFKPKCMGFVSWVDLIPIDATALTFRLHNGAISSRAPTGLSTAFAGISDNRHPFIPEIYDNGVPLFFRLGARNYSLAFDSVSQTLSFYDNGSASTVSHGLQNGAMLYNSALFGGSWPAAFATNTIYYVVNRTATTFQLSATLGGSPIAFGSTVTSAAGWIAYGYTVNFTTGVLTLLSTPTTPLRITAGSVLQNDVGSNEQLLNVLSYLLFTQGSLSQDLRDEASFQSIGAPTNNFCGVYLNGKQQTSMRDVMNVLAAGANLSFGISPEGLFQVRAIDLPSAPAVQSFTASDIQDGSMRRVDALRPVDFGAGKATVYYGPTNLDSPLTYRPNYTDAGGAQALKVLVAGATYSATPPLDNNPAFADVRQPHPEFNLVYGDSDSAVSEQSRLKGLFLENLGVYEFYTRLPASVLNMGDTIAVTFPRLSWKAWGASDPASPDNTATIDSTLAVVLGTDVDLSRDGPFKVKVTCFRQMPSNYPSSSPAGDYSLEEDSSICLREDGTIEYEEY